MSNRESRPWGYFETLLSFKYLKIKKLVVYQSSALSLQRHSFRHEVWLVTSGRPKIEIGNRLDLGGHMGVYYVRRGEKHRITNPFNGKVVIYELQFGSKVEESDIERLDDNYGRK